MFKILVVTFFIFLAKGAFSADIGPSPLPNRVWDELSEELDDSGQRLNRAIFEALTEFDLFSMGIGEGSIGVGVKRKVFDNRNILDTFTVVDFFEIPLSYPLNFLDGVDLPIEGMNLFLGINASLEVMNIRQVYPRDLRKLPDLTDLRDDVVEYLEDNKGLGQLSFLPWRTENDLTRARYRDWDNLFLHPLRLPLSQSRIKSYPVGEIASYNLNGALELGLEAGWTKIKVLDYEGIEFGANTSIFLGGSYQISILKETRRFAQVKVAKTKSQGHKYGIGVGTEEIVLFKGLAVLGKNVAQIDEKLIPFSFGVTDEKANIFDTSYRFDLENAQALEAYEKAVFGSFKMASNLAAKGEGVWLVYDRKERQKTRQKRYNMEFSIFFEKNAEAKRQSSRATIKIDGKELYIFKGVSSSKRTYETLWNTYENKSLIISSISQGNDFLTSSMFLRVEGRIKDSDTDSLELRRYTSHIEEMLREPDLFPDFPLYRPLNTCSEQEEHRLMRKRDANVQKFCQKNIFVPINYEKTEFYYRLSFDKRDIFSFLNYSESKMWEVMEKSFGVGAKEWDTFAKRSLYAGIHSLETLANLPLSLLNLELESGSRLYGAIYFVKYWQEAKRAKNAEELTAIFAELFYSSRFGEQYLRAFLRTIERPNMAYILTARADEAFDPRDEQKGDFSPVERTLDEIDRITNFDEIGPHYDLDIEAAVQNLNITKLGPEKFEVTFDLKKVPKFFYFRIDQTQAFLQYTVLERFILINQGRFHAGSNSIIVNSEHRHEDASVEGRLARAFFTGKFTTLKLAVTNNGKTWGSVSMKKAKLPLIEDKRLFPAAEQVYSASLNK